MGKDDWEPDDDAYEVTAEDKAILDTVKTSGMTVSELTTRAERDASSESNPGRNAPATPATEEVTVLTEDQRRAIAQEARQIAKQEVSGQRMVQSMESGIQNAVNQAPGFGSDTTPAERDDIQHKVARQLSEIEGIEKMPRGEFDNKVTEVTEKVLASEMAIAKRRMGQDEVPVDEEVQARVDGHVATGESSTTTGGAARSTSKAPPPPESDADNMDEPTYGVGAQDWPTEAQISRQNAQDKAAWRRTLTARGG